MFSLLDVIIFQFTGIMKHEIIAFPKRFPFWGRLAPLECNPDFTTVEFWFFKPPWEKQISLNHQEVWKNMAKITVFDWWREGRLGLNYKEFQKTESLRNRDSTVKVNFCCGSQHSVHWQSFGNNSAVGGPGGDTDPSEASCLVTIGKLQPTSVPQASDLVSYPPVTEFVSRHSLDGKFTFVDQR